MADKVFVVVASSADSPAQAFVRRYAGQGLRLLTPGDLSYAGWCYRLGAMPTAVAIIGEQPVAVRNIVGVLTRLSSVSAYDVDHIAAADQTYVAAEMQAFLFSWLTSLNCPVVNQPTPALPGRTGVESCPVGACGSASRPAGYPHLPACHIRRHICRQGQTTSTGRHGNHCRSTGHWQSCSGPGAAGACPGRGRRSRPASRAFQWSRGWRRLCRCTPVAQSCCCNSRYHRLGLPPRPCRV
jgi:hypothetical protein